VAIDVEKRCAVAFDVNDVIVPELVVQGLRSHDDRRQRAGAKASGRELCHREIRDPAPSGNPNGGATV